MNVAYLLTGGNIGNRLQTLTAANEAIQKQAGPIVKISALYETEAWGLTQQQKFLNQALEVHTDLDAAGLLNCLLDIEQSLGRKRDIKYGPRIIDIDILLFNDAVINTNTLTIPHPEIQNRRFALQCLAEIAGPKIHPVFKKTIAQLLAQCTDPLQVNKYEY